MAEEKEDYQVSSQLYAGQPEDIGYLQSFWKKWRVTERYERKTLTMFNFAYCKSSNIYKQKV